ncbi:MAG: PAS domain-containing protein, partial [Pseudomonadales bacterium]|nr:PAS domain-containing protein [Pseudomonadales bacterium]
MIRQAVQSILILLMVAACAAVASAAEYVRFHRYSVDQGLPQSVVQAIAQDTRGFIWLGTQGGLSRYDGHEFVNYFLEPDDANSISNDWIPVLHADDQGMVWIGTQRGLNRLDTKTGAITRYYSDPADPQSLSGNHIRAIEPDARGWLWIGDDTGGITRMDLDSGTFERVTDGGLANQRVRDLFLDAGGFLWIGTNGGGLLRLDPLNSRVRQIDLEGSDDRVHAIAADARGDIWVGSSEAGLYRLDSQGQLKRRYRKGDGSGLSSNAIRVLFVDSRGDVWIGTDSDGVNRFVTGEDRFESIRRHSANDRSLNDDHVAALFEDRGGVIWVGTQVGVNTWNPLLSAFATYSSPAEGNGGLTNNWISSFAEGDDGKVFVGTAGGGVSLLELDTGEIHPFGPGDGPGGLRDPRVFALAVSPQGELWAGTRAGGLFRYRAEQGDWENFRHDPEDAGSISFDAITSLLFDSRGRLWIGTYGGGLNRYLGEGRFERFRHDPGNPASLCSDRMLSIYEDRGARLWIGTHGDGLCRLEPDTGVFETYRHDSSKADSLASNVAWYVTEDGAGNLWIGTAERGVSVWRAEDRQSGQLRFEHLGIEEGLAGRTIYSLVSDSAGRVWAAGNRGLTRIDPGTRETVNFTVADGLQGNEFNFAAALRLADGRILFGGNNGFNAFYPHEIRTNLHAPPVVLTDLIRLNESVLPHTLMEESGVVQFDHRDQLIAFEFAALDFTDPSGNRYEHFLEGFDTDWVIDGNRRRLTYTNLLPGDYRLRVRAANGDGVWSSDELVLPFRVLPAPWATWWAKSGYVLAVLMVFFAVYRVQARRLAYAEEIRKINTTLVDQINQRQKKETELRLSEQRSQRYLDVVEVIILALDRTGRITMINQKGARVLGGSESEIVGSDFYETFVPAEVRGEVRERFEQVAQYAYSESPIKPKEGIERLIAWHTIPLPAGEGMAAGILISGTDVTQVRNLERQLRDAQKMEALGTMARGVAHDFNNILSSILGYAELSLAELDSSSRARDYLRKLETSVDRARELVQGILTFGRGNPRRPKPVSVAGAVAEALQLLKPVLGERVRIEDVLDPESGAVLADPTQLLQVVLNLGTNAGQAMGEKGGVLQVRVQPHDVDIEKARSTAVLAPGSHVKITVADNGPGMDDFTLARIFDPFFTTRRREEGTGLGLAVVHGIVTQLRGYVEVESEVGRGSTFTIYLPCCEESAAGRV